MNTLPTSCECVFVSQQPNVMTTLVLKAKSIHSIFPIPVCLPVACVRSNECVNTVFAFLNFACHLAVKCVSKQLHKPRPASKWNVMHIEHIDRTQNKTVDTHMMISSSPLPMKDKTLCGTAGVGTMPVIGGKKTEQKTFAASRIRRVFAQRIITSTLQRNYINIDA